MPKGRPIMFTNLQGMSKAERRAAAKEIAAKVKEEIAERNRPVVVDRPSRVELNARGQLGGFFAALTTEELAEFDRLVDEEVDFEPQPHCLMVGA